MGLYKCKDKKCGWTGDGVISIEPTKTEDGYSKCPKCEGGAIINYKDPRVKAEAEKAKVISERHVKARLLADVDPKFIDMIDEIKNKTGKTRKDIICELIEEKLNEIKKAE